eukprot:CAMPEP_0206134656 /NCGR_PEP_ID=MMETSP1473-20131121/134_1 /ASSEMBLY_ACC=CAM_ASM_001109 /TAXON_ID=1461547 /ORGANISM="Stichococcus sp, Strain RCC1054" /LENGTH=373 /DNA_ID=CAMNT_0053526275 /DNA_START=271 /DNA_END=1393 /DNA_ORIENTATION=-
MCASGAQGTVASTLAHTGSSEVNAVLVRGQQTGDASEDFPALKKLPDIWLSDQETPRTAARGASTVPRTPVEVDNELWEVLELCSMEELEEVYDCLFGASPLSPVVKSLVTESEPAAGHLRGRDSLMRSIDQRFRFLAADAGATLRGRWPSYREALLSVRDRLKVDCPSTLPTAELETEIYVHMLETYAAANNAQRQSAAEVNSYAVKDAMDDGDGTAASKPRFGGRGWVAQLERIAAPIKLGGSELLPVVTNFMSAITVSSVRKAALQQMGVSMLRSTVQYEAAVAAVCRTATCSAARQASITASQRGLTAAAARFGTMRGIMSTLGPLMWAAFAAELALKSIGTDYGRLVRCIYVLSQVRLVHTHGWTSSV